MKRFYQPKESANAEIKEKSSKFLAYSFAVQSEEEAVFRLKELKKLYFDASHHCYAYLIGLEKQIWKISDDGEPAHTAGDPILGQIRAAGLTNTLVVVIRFFGGIKLGVGGLISAYKSAAKSVLSKVIPVEVFDFVFVQLQFGYHQIAWIEKTISSLHTKKIEREFEENCSIRLFLNKSHINDLTKLLQGSTVIVSFPDVNAD